MNTLGISLVENGKIDEALQTYSQIGEEDESTAGLSAHSNILLIEDIFVAKKIPRCNSALTAQAPTTKCGTL